MKHERILLVTLMAATLWGCPSDPPAETDAGRDAAAPDAGGDDGGGGDDADVDGGPIEYTNDCSGYCMATLAACTGDRAQYASMAECMEICTDAAWPAGTPGATAGNSIACRIYHASVAVSMPAIHCGHTGATGGGVCVGATQIFRADPPSAYTRVDRMGMPAVSTALVPSADKDAYNDGSPEDDLALTFAAPLVTGLTALHTALDDDLMGASLTPCSMTMTRSVPGVPVPLPLCAAQQYAPSAPVVTLVVPDTLTIDPARPAGFPNGRRLADPVVDITLAVILLDLETTPGQSATSFIDTTTGDGALSQFHNDAEFLTEFPYLAPAHAP